MCLGHGHEPDGMLADSDGPRFRQAALRCMISGFLRLCACRSLLCLAGTNDSDSRISARRAGMPAAPRPRTRGGYGTSAYCAARDGAAGKTPAAVLPVAHGVGQRLAPAAEVMILRIFTDQDGQLDGRHFGQQLLVPLCRAFRPRRQVTRFPLARVTEAHRHNRNP